MKEPRQMKSLQQNTTRICAEVALKLLANGAESDLVVECAHRIGKALGAEQVECLLTANGIIVTTLFEHHSLTTSRRCPVQGVNFSVVAQIQQLVIEVEKQGATATHVYRLLKTQVHSSTYHPQWVRLMVAISCASFARLSGGDGVVMAVTFVAAYLGISVRHFLHGLHLNVFIIFIGSAFAATLVSALAYRFHLGNDPHYAMAASVLLLVPGVPLMNSFSDILKGHANMGFGRWLLATVMTLGACMGMVFAMMVMNINLQEMFYG